MVGMGPGSGVGSSVIRLRCRGGPDASTCSSAAPTTRLYHQWFGSGHWANWEPLGGVLSAGPTAASWEPNRLDVFVRGTDNGLYHRWWDGSQWRGFEPHGGALTANPSAVSKSWNRIDVFVRGTDQQALAPASGADPPTAAVASGASRQAPRRASAAGNRPQQDRRGRGGSVIVATYSRSTSV